MEQSLQFLECPSNEFKLEDIDLGPVYIVSKRSDSSPVYIEMKNQGELKVDLYDSYGAAVEILQLDNLNFISNSISDKLVSRLMRALLGFTSAHPEITIDTLKILKDDESDHSNNGFTLSLQFIHLNEIENLNEALCYFIRALGFSNLPEQFEY